jgi:TM2 domain-containing membrane protein YozV/RNA polymerase subunit RPABC4/transcription elongation factor Spt4
MALVSCWECSGMVSTEAAACPHCGAPDPNRFSRQPEPAAASVSDAPTDETGKVCADCGSALVTGKIGLRCPVCDLPLSPEPLPTKPVLFCRTCGNQVLREAYACPSCGAAPMAGHEHCQWCGEATPATAIVCLACGRALGKTKEGSTNRILVGVVAIFLGWLGVHKFMLGYNREGILMLLASTIGGLLTGGLATLAMLIVGIIEGGIFLTTSDSEFFGTYVQDEKTWF